MKLRIHSNNVPMLHNGNKGHLRLPITFFIAGFLAFVVNAAKVEHTVDGITWRLHTDTDAKTVQLGEDAISSSQEDTRGAVISGMPDSLQVPSSFIISDVQYAVSRVASRAFARSYHGGKLYNVTFPLDRDIIFGSVVFNFSPVLSDILFKGPSCVAAGKTQTYSTMILPDLQLHNDGYYQQSIVFGCAKLKHVVVGPNVKVDDCNKLKSFFGHSLEDKSPIRNAVLFVPRNENNMTWDGCHEDGFVLGGFDNSVVYYGPEEAFDIEMYDTYATFIPNTEEGLTIALELAQTFETVFNIDARLAVRKRINMTAEVAESALQSVTLTAAPPWYLTFAVQTQSQLDNVLAVVQKDIPIIIDIDGATEDICVPEGRQVAILAKGGWTFGKKHKGLIIQFK